MPTKAAVRKIKVIAIIASLAGLALVLSPTFSILQAPGGATSRADSLLRHDLVEEDPTVVEQVSDEDLSSCGTVNESLDGILGVSSGTVDDRNVASDRLVAEFCSRPALIHEIMSSDYHALSLVAYACDASSGKISTAAMQDSLLDYREIYCSSANRLIINESNTFLDTVEQFRTKYLPILQSGLPDEEGSEGIGNYTGSKDGSNIGAENEEGAGSYFNATSVEMTLDEVTSSLEECIALLDAGNYYPAAQSFDNASKKFVALFQEEGDA